MSKKKMKMPKFSAQTCQAHSWHYGGKEPKQSKNQNQEVLEYSLGSGKCKTAFLPIKNEKLLTFYDILVGFQIS